MQKRTFSPIPDAVAISHDNNVLYGLGKAVNAMLDQGVV